MKTILIIGLSFVAGFVTAKFFEEKETVIKTEVRKVNAPVPPLSDIPSPVPSQEKKEFKRIPFQDEKGRIAETWLDPKAETGELLKDGDAPQGGR